MIGCIHPITMRTELVVLEPKKKHFLLASFQCTSHNTGPEESTSGCEKKKESNLSLCQLRFSPGRLLSCKVPDRRKGYEGREGDWGHMGGKGGRMLLLDNASIDIQHPPCTPHDPAGAASDKDKIISHHKIPFVDSLLISLSPCEVAFSLSWWLLKEIAQAVEKGDARLILRTSPGDDEDWRGRSKEKGIKTSLLSRALPWQQRGENPW